MDCTCYLGLGSNEGNKLKVLATAAHMIQEKIGVISCKSKMYSSKAWGFQNQEDFINQVLEVQTKLSPLVLLGELKGIEQLIGRVETFRWGPRLIDIDVLLYENLIINVDELKIPHIHMTERKFVLSPLKEINPTLKHPIRNMTISELESSCNDVTRVCPI